MTITVNIVRNQNNKPQDKLADAELHGSAHHRLLELVVFKESHLACQSFA